MEPRKLAGKGIRKAVHFGSHYPGGAVVKNPPAIQETLVQFLGREDPLEKG